MKKLPELTYNRIHTNFRLTQNRVSITVNFVCLLIFLQALRIKGRAVAASDNFVHNSDESYRTLVGNQIHPNPKKIRNPPNHTKTYAKTKAEGAVFIYKF